MQLSAILLGVAPSARAGCGRHRLRPRIPETAPLWTTPFHRPTQRRAPARRTPRTGTDLRCTDPLIWKRGYCYLLELDQFGSVIPSIPDAASALRIGLSLSALWAVEKTSDIILRSYSSELVCAGRDARLLQRGHVCGPDRRSVEGECDRSMVVAAASRATALVPRSSSASSEISVRFDTQDSASFHLARTATAGL